MNKFSDSLGPTSVRTNNLRQLIGKCTTLTLAVQTSPTAHLHLHHHGGALHAEILKMTEVSAVSTARGIRDRSPFPVPPQRSPNDRRLARPQGPARPAREPTPCSFACSLIGKTPDQTNQHRKSGRPTKKGWMVFVTWPSRRRRARRGGRLKRQPQRRRPEDCGASRQIKLET
jgi:hypothetical protein